MTAKEKAEWLVNKFNTITDLGGAELCALIAVDEIIKSNPTNPLKKQYAFSYPEMIY